MVASLVCVGDLSSLQLARYRLSIAIDASVSLSLSLSGDIERIHLATVVCYKAAILNDEDVETSQEQLPMTDKTIDRVL